MHKSNATDFLPKPNATYKIKNFSFPLFCLIFEAKSGVVEVYFTRHLEEVIILRTLNSRSLFQLIFLPCQVNSASSKQLASQGFDLIG